MGELVSEGTCFNCPFCSSKLKISVPSSLAESESKKLANTENYQFPPPGGQCQITSSPCMPSVANIDPGQTVVQIDGKIALGVGCKFQCAKGGLLTVDSPGQTTSTHHITLKGVMEVAAAAMVLIPVVGEVELGVAAAVEGAEAIEAAAAAAESEGAAEAAVIKGAGKAKVGKRRKNWLPDGKEELGPPGGSLERRNPETGQLIQKRYYDSEGKPLKDIDFLHDHGAGDPHVHDWNYPSLQAPNPERGDGRPVNPDAIIPEDIK